MKTIWKYALAPETLIDVPMGARFLFVDFQDGVPHVWAELDPEAVPEQRTLFVVGTGHSLPVVEYGRDLSYIGSAQQVLSGGWAVDQDEDGSLRSARPAPAYLVWHVYESVETRF